MSNFYALFSFHGKEKEKFYLERQLLDKHLSIGWGEINPIGLTSDQIRKALEKEYPDKSGHNLSHGVKSLSLFCALKPGEIIFVRGDAEILDIAIVTGEVRYAERDGHSNNHEDYRTMVPFTPLFNDKQSKLLISNIPDELRKDFVHDGGRSLTMKEIPTNIARELVKHILLQAA